MAKVKITVLRVAALRPGFRRAGLVFGTDPQDIQVSEISKEQRAAILADRMLVASEIEIDVDAPDPVKSSSLASDDAADLLADTTTLAATTIPGVVAGKAAARKSAKPATAAPVAKPVAPEPGK